MTLFWFADAQVQQPSVLDAGDAGHGERVGQPQRQRLEHPTGAGCAAARGPR